MAREFGAEDFFGYDDFALCLSHPRVEAVFIATANQPHAQLAARAAAAGKHVLCEKPMATSVDGCLDMIQACRAANVRLMIAYRKYFEPGSLALKKLVGQSDSAEAALLGDASPGQSTVVTPPVAHGAGAQ